MKVIKTIFYVIISIIFIVSVLFFLCIIHKKTEAEVFANNELNIKIDYFEDLADLYREDKMAFSKFDKIQLCDEYDKFVTDFYNHYFWAEILNWFLCDKEYWNYKEKFLITYLDVYEIMEMDF